MESPRASLRRRPAKGIIRGRSRRWPPRTLRMAHPEDCGDDIFQPSGRVRPNLLTEAAAAALNESVRFARETRWDSVRSPHVFMGLLAVPDAGMQTWGERLRADLPKLLGQFQELFHQDEGEEEAI